VWSCRGCKLWSWTYNVMSLNMLVAWYVNKECTVEQCRESIECVLVWRNIAWQVQERVLHWEVCNWTFCESMTQWFCADWKLPATWLCEKLAYVDTVQYEIARNYKTERWQSIWVLYGNWVLCRHNVTGKKAFTLKRLLIANVVGAYFWEGWVTTVNYS